MNESRIRRSVRDHIWGPAGSLLFHAVFLLALLFLVRGPEGALPTIGNQRFDVVEPSPERAPADALPLPPRETYGDTEGDSEQPFADVDVPAQTEVAFATPGDDGFSAPSADLFLGVDAEIFENIAYMPGLLQERLRRIGQSGGPVGPAGRGKAGSPSGIKGGGDVDAAIVRALRWLRDHQADDGSWGPNRPAMTGLALLTFLGYGQTTGSKEYGSTVRRAIDRLCTDQQADGWWCVDRRQHAAVYEHAIATYAMSEAYGLTRIPELRERMERAVRVIVAGQQPGGLWDYGYARGERRDTSVSGWQIQALKAAYVNGAEVEGLAMALTRASDGLKAMKQPAGGHFLYSDAGSARPSMTSVAVLGLELLQQRESGEARDGLQALRDMPCDWEKPPRWPLYTWYYQTQALFHDQGSTWKMWSRQFTTAFLRNQNADGSWYSPGADSAGNEESKHGPVYSTTLCALTLEVFYRYAPVSQALHEERIKPAARPADDVRVEII